MEEKEKLKIEDIISQHRVAASVLIALCVLSAYVLTSVLLGFIIGNYGKAFLIAFFGWIFFGLIVYLVYAVIDEYFFYR